MSEHKAEDQEKLLGEKILKSKKLIPRASFESLARIHDVDKSVVAKILTHQKTSSRMATPAKKIRKSAKKNVAETTFCDENDSASSSSRSYETLQDAIKSNALSDLYKEGSFHFLLYNIFAPELTSENFIISNFKVQPWSALNRDHRRCWMRSMNI